MENDLRAHGIYPFSDWTKDNPPTLIFRKVAEISEENAYKTYLHYVAGTLSVWEGESLQPASFEDFSKSFINKGFRVLLSMGNAVVALYRHDDVWHLIAAKEIDFVRCYNKMHLARKERVAHPADAIPYKEDFL